jgi:PAS domain
MFIVTQSDQGESSDPIRHRGPPPPLVELHLAQDAMIRPVDLAQLPALPVLARLPLPVLAIQNRGTVLFANQAIADLLGYSIAAMSGMTLGQILDGLPGSPCVHHYLHAHAGEAVSLIHADGSIVLVQMSASALLRYDDPVVLSAFVPLKPRSPAHDFGSWQRVTRHNPQVDPIPELIAKPAAAGPPRRRGTSLPAHTRR